MGSNAIIIGDGSLGAKNGAPPSILGDLYNAVAGLTGSHRAVINGYGEAVGPSSVVAWTPQQIASFVKGGGIWIDLCGWPMYYQVSPTDVSQVTTLGAAGFQSFLSAWDSAYWHNILGTISFAVPFQATTPFGTFPDSRGWPTQGVLPVGFCWLEGTFQPNSYSQVQALSANGWSMAGSLHRPGEGYYFYGSVNPGSGAGPYNGLPPQIYAQFILNTLAGRGPAYGIHCGAAMPSSSTSPSSGSTATSSTPSTSTSSSTTTSTTPSSRSSSSTTSTTSISPTVSPSGVQSCPSGYTLQNGLCVQNPTATVGPSPLMLFGGAALLGVGGYAAYRTLHGTPPPSKGA